MKKKDRALKGLSGHRSSAFMVALKNMTEFAQKTSVIDMGNYNKYHCSSSTSLVARVMLSLTQSIYLENQDEHVNFFCRKIDFENTWLHIMIKVLIPYLPYTGSFFVLFQNEPLLTETAFLSWITWNDFCFHSE